MNNYQKSATFILRLVGFLAFTIGSMGLVWFAIQSARAVEKSSRGDGPAGAAFWLIAGAVVYGLSKPFGRFLGTGLD